MCTPRPEYNTLTSIGGINRPIHRYLEECKQYGAVLALGHSERNLAFRYTDAYRLSGNRTNADDIDYESVVEPYKQFNKIADELPATFNQDPPAWQTHLKNATTIEDIILVIKYFGWSSIADRLYHLYDLPVDEPYENPMNLESVKGFALFIMNNMHLPYPDITVSSDGRVAIEWDVVDHGGLILHFLSSEHVEYLEVLQQSESAHQKQYNSGVSSIDTVTDIIKHAIYQLTHV